MSALRPKGHGDLKGLAASIEFNTCVMAAVRHHIGDQNIAPDVLAVVTDIRSALHDRAGMSWAEIDAVPGLEPVGSVKGAYTITARPLTGPRVIDLAERLGAITRIDCL